MKALLNLFTAVIVLLLVTFTAKADYTAGTFPPALSSAMKSGNAAEVSKYFNSSVELVVLGDESVSSKNQAEMILKKFFEKNTPISFSVMFEGGKDKSQYAIGKLVAKTGTFRVYFLIKGQIIHQIRIEKEDGN